METQGQSQAEIRAFGEKMFDLLKRQHQYFIELQKLSHEQRMLIKAQQSEDLLHLLAKRQMIVNAIGQLHQQSAVFRENWPKIKDLLPEMLKKNISVLLVQVQQMLNQIIEQDQQDCQELSASKQQVAAELNQTNKVRAANTYYNQPKVNPQRPSGSSFQITG
jgi:thymidylate synthase ThyX